MKTKIQEMRETHTQGWMIVIAFTLLILFSANPTHAQERDFVPHSLQGGDGVYIMLWPGEIIGGDRVSRILLEKRVANRGRWQRVGETTGPLPQQQFRAVVGNQFLSWLWREHLELESEAEFWNFVRQNPDTESYGFATFRSPLLEALGYIIADRDAASLQPGTTINYRTSHFGQTGNLLREHSWNHTIIAREPFARPMAFSKSEADSMISIIWRAPLDVNNRPFWAQIYRREASGEKTELLDNLIMAQANEKEDSVYYLLNDMPPPGYLYWYHIVPQNYVGLQGAPSDTVSVIARHISSVAAIEDLTARDSLNGVFLSWNIPEPNILVSGLIIERARNPEGPFLDLDTIGARATTYFDFAVLQGVTYYYRLRWMGIRLEQFQQMAWATHTFYNRGSLLFPPSNLTASSMDDGVLLSWEPARDMNVVGFYVLRRTQDEREWETVSPMIDEARYLDNDPLLLGNTTYAYAVQAVSINDMISVPSDVVFIRPEKAVALPMPEGLVMGSSAGVNTLRWNDMQARVTLLSHYNIYRKAGNENLTERADITPTQLRQLGFELIASVSENTFYNDTDLPAGQMFIYAVTAADRYNNEGTPAFTVAGGYEIALAPPAWFGLRNTPDGVEISWDRSIADLAPDVVVLRRTPNQRQATEIRRVSSSEGRFIDNPTPGNIYFYSLSLRNNAQVSEPSLEKSIRR